MPPRTRKRIAAVTLSLSALFLSFVRAQTGEQLRDLALRAPKPQYPHSAGSRRQTGSGVALLTIDKSTGNVVTAEMAVSTNSKDLDDASLDAFRRWRFKPNMIAKARIPISFVLSGREPYITLDYARPASDVLAGFLGRQNLLKSPVPQYPTKASWTDKEGTGVYEMFVNGEGKVTEVKILKSSGDATFDHVAVTALRQWLFRKGPGTVQLPLAFTLSRHKYGVRIVR